MVEVLERRAREARRPIEAARRYAEHTGPASPVDRVGRLRSLFEHDPLASGQLALAVGYSPRPLDDQPAERFPKGAVDFANFHIKDIARALIVPEGFEVEVLRGGGPSREERKHVDTNLLADCDQHVARSDREESGKGRERQPANQEETEGEEGGEQEGEQEEETEEEKKEEPEARRKAKEKEQYKWIRVVPGRLEDLLEPRKGSCERSETGERNVAKRRHGRPCGQQSVDEINGHCPQGEETSRLGISRSRRFWSTGIRDHWQQRPDPQSVSHTTCFPFFLILQRLLYLYFPPAGIPPGIFH